jgi:hypothetical protein
VHFDVDSTSAAAGGTPGPSGQQWEGDDPFLSTEPQPSHQVSILYINFTTCCSADLIQGGSQTESFNLRTSFELGSSPEGHPSGPATPSRRQRRAQKKTQRSRLTGSTDDVFQFFAYDKDSDTRRCKFCL